MDNCKYIKSVQLAKEISSDSYLKELPVIKFLEKNPLELSKNVTFFVGENGTGKSTLIEAIAIAFGFNAEGGSKNFSFSTKNSHSELYKHLKLVKYLQPKDGYFLRSESFYNSASYLEELDAVPASAPPLLGGYGGVSLHDQSHGESFFALIKNRFFGNGLYILDEPEAALSPIRLLSLLCRIKELENKDSQFIIATHSPILMSYPDAEVFEFTQDGIKSVNYQETEHFQVTKRFLNDPEGFYKHLFQE